MGEVGCFVHDCTFKENTYHQIDGTAMGTACAPIYANIVVYMLERSVLKSNQIKSNVCLYPTYLGFTNGTPSGVDKQQGEIQILEANKCTMYVGVLQTRLHQTTEIGQQDRGSK